MLNTYQDKGSMVIHTGSPKKMSLYKMGEVRIFWIHHLSPWIVWGGYDELWIHQKFILGVLEAKNIPRLNDHLTWNQLPDFDQIFVKLPRLGVLPDPWHHHQLIHFRYKSTYLFFHLSLLQLLINFGLSHARSWLLCPFPMLLL